MAERLAKESGARVVVTDEMEKAVDDVDFLYTDVWLSMGEPQEKWGERISELLPFQINAAMLELTQNPRSRSSTVFRPCTTSRRRSVEMVYDKWGLDALEITEDVFESEASVVFDQAENRLHTIKAIMVATLAG